MIVINLAALIATSDLGLILRFYSKINSLCNSSAFQLCHKWTVLLEAVAPPSCLLCSTTSKGHWRSLGHAMPTSGVNTALRADKLIHIKEHQSASHPKALHWYPICRRRLDLEDTLDARCEQRSPRIDDILQRARVRSAAGHLAVISH